MLNAAQIQEAIEANCRLHIFLAKNTVADLASSCEAAKHRPSRVEPLEAVNLPPDQQFLVRLPPGSIVVPSASTGRSHTSASLATSALSFCSLATILPNSTEPAMPHRT